MKPPIIKELRDFAEVQPPSCFYERDLLERAANRIAGLEAQVAEKEELIATCYAELAWYYHETGVAP